MQRYLARHYRIIFTAGFAMFAMFFGAGNLVFPLALGYECYQYPFLASLGLFVSAVIIPFLGLLGIIAYNGNRIEFFNTIGKTPAFVLTTITLCLMGPFGAIPRCIIVAYAGFELLLPSMPFWVFSILFCLLILIIIWNYDRMIPIIGSFLTPWLIISIATIIIGGFWHPAPTIPSDIETLCINNSTAFSSGFFTGYQTMDLLAAFFFCATTIDYIKTHIQKQERPTRLMPLSLFTSLVGAGLLAIVYLGFVSLGAKYAPLLTETSTHQMLLVIAEYTLGQYALPIVSITILLACATTVAVLVALFGDFIKKDISRNRISTHTSIILTLLIAFSVSLLGFNTLFHVLGRIFEIAYPAIIALVIANITHKLFNIHYSKEAFWLTLTTMILLQII